MAPLHPSPESDVAAERDKCNRKRPAGYRWLSVLLPQQVFNNLHIQARLSDMSFQHYMQEFCSEAWPYTTPQRPKDTAPEQAPPSAQT
jgi:hypothetical protein